MNTRSLLIVTALLELATGVTLLLLPAFAVELLLGEPLTSPASMLIGRLAGAALFTIGLSCWLERNRAPRPGLVVGLLTYNVAVPLLFTYAALAEHLHGILLWPACGLHLALALWCVAALRARTP